MSVNSAPLIAIVVGEASGDILGAGLMEALIQLHPTARFIGVGGPRMEALGMQSLFPQDRLAVMGFIDPLKRLPELLGMRKQLIQFIIEQSPAVLVGVDYPDFNLGVELAVKAKGIKTVHYVSPSVWAWRQGRVKKIAKAVDLMLTLLPFEAQFYRDHKVPVKFVGHPLADEIAFQNDQNEALSHLQLAPRKEGERVVALLPGSRSGEVERMGKLFLDAGKSLLQRHSNIRLLVPSANDKRHSQLEALLTNMGSELPVTLIKGQSQTVMAAADVVLMASGTTTLEATLLKKPMVIAYKVAPFSYWIFKRLVKVKFIGLPNLLAGHEIAPEFIQHDATPERLAKALERQLSLPEDEYNALKKTYQNIHEELRCDASRAAASAVTSLFVSREQELAHG